MGTLDIVLLLCFIPALVRGIQKGFVEQLVSIISIIAGAFLAFKFSQPLSALAAERITAVAALDPKLLNVLCFIAVAVVAVLLLHLLGALLTRTLKLVSLGFINRLLGVVFALLKAALVIGLLIFFFDSFNEKWGLVNPETLQNSVVYTALRDAALKVFPYLKTLISGTPAETAA